MNKDRDEPELVALSRMLSPETERQLAAFMAYWAGMCRGNDVPNRSDIDPRGIESLLENALIAEKIAPGLARFRIAGTHLGDLLGMEVRGMPLSAFIAPGDREDMASLLSDLFERPATLRLMLRAPKDGPDRPELKGTLLLLPLRSDLGDVSRALGCLVTEGDPGRAPRRFNIVTAQVTPVAGARARGFAAPPARYDAGQAHPSERPYLRLVKPD